jgi:VWFA-related protein
VGFFFAPAGVALAVLAAQAQTPVVQPFRSAVDVVRVDVSAIDESGRPITDLTAADFELRVDGRPRTIVSAQFVAVPSAAASPTGPRDAHYSTNVDSLGGRLIMIVIDRSSIVAGRGKAAIEAASRFVTQLHRADRVALATIPHGPQVPFTADHALIEQRIREIDGTALASFGIRNLGITDALAFERKDDLEMQNIVERECGNATAGVGGRGGGQSDVLICMNEVRSEAIAIAQDARERARNSIRGLRALLDSLPPSQTPKLMVLVSEGLVVDRELGQLNWLDARAAASHVTIYSLHLDPSTSDASQARAMARPSRDRVVKEEGLQRLAQATRGDVFRIISNSDFAFQRLSLELSGYYLLGFEPSPGDRNGRPHDISVGVRRNGVIVRSRRQFSIDAEAPGRTAEREIISALRDPLPAAEIPVKLAAYSFRDPHHEKLRLLVAAEIDRSINPDAQLSAGYVVVDFDGKHVASQMDTPLPERARRDGSIQRYFSTVLVDAGKYTVKFVVVDERRRGSVELVVDAHLNAAGPIRATDLLLADGVGRAGTLPVAPAVTGELTGGFLHGYLELFADLPETLEKVSVTLEIVQPDTLSVVERIPVALATTKESVRCRVGAARVNISKLPPGHYLARAVIAVGLDAVGEVSRPFSIPTGSNRLP